MKKQFSGIFKKYVLITLGCILYAAGVSLFLDPNSLAPGGVSGIAIIISHFIKPINVGLVIVLINIPIMIAGVVKFGFRFLFSSIYAVLMSSLFMEIFEMTGFAAMLKFV